MNEYQFEIFWNADAKVWVATCDEIPLTVEDSSLDKLLYRVKLAAPELIEREKIVYE